MNKKQLQKIEYERQCYIRRKYIPVILHKGFSSLKIVEILKKNERKIKWSKYPELLVNDKMATREQSDITDACVMRRLGSELMNGISDADLDKIYVNIYACGPVIICRINKIEDVKTDFGTFHYLKKNEILVNGKLLLISNHALDRINERAFPPDSNDLNNRYLTHMTKWRCLEMMCVGNTYGDKLEVFIPYRHQERSYEMIYRKIGYFVISEDEKYCRAKSFILPGFIGTPEEFLMDKSFHEISEEEKIKIHEKSRLAIKRIIEDDKDFKLTDYECITPAWKNRLQDSFNHG